MNGFKLLKILVHQVHHSRRAAVGSLLHLRQPRTLQQLQLIHRKARYQIRGRLDAPIELRAAADYLFGNLKRAIEALTGTVADAFARYAAA